MASGSDDSKVKIWSTNTARSVLNIEAMVRGLFIDYLLAIIPRTMYLL